MGATYQVERGPDPDPAHDDLVVHYGWAHLHAFVDLLAAEERIDLRSMTGHGGSRPWAEVDTALAPLFNPGAWPGRRLSAAECIGMGDRISEIIDAWSRGAYAGAADPEMKRDQLVTLRRLKAVIEACVATGRALMVG